MRTIQVKMLCVFFIFYFAAITANAQDKIYKPDSTIIQAKVVEVTDVEIKYKKFTNQSGPTYTISIPEVWMIVYANGEKEVYNAPKVKQPPIVPVTPPATQVQPPSNQVTPNNVNPVTDQKPTTANTNNNGQPESKGGLYLIIYPGFAMSLASQQFDNNNTMETSSLLVESVHGSYGKGLNFGIGVGMKLGEHINFELGLNYLKSFNITTTITDNSGPIANESTNKRHASMLRLIPAVVIEGNESKLTPYARVGLVMKLTGKVVSDYTETTQTELEKVTEFSGRMSFGFASALGMKFGTGKISCFGELAMISQAWAPAKSILTTYTKNGADQLPGLPLSKTETDFVNDYTVTATSDDSEPAKSAKRYFPFSSFGINVGLRFVF